MSVPQGMPPAVEVDLAEPLSAYWRRRLDQHNLDSYVGVPLAKFPEDLRVYQHLIWESRADTVVELGTKWGGSMLWFRDQLRTFGAYGRLERPPLVVGVDLATGHAESMLDRADERWRQEITLIDGDLADATTAAAVRDAVGPERRCLVVEDAAHTAEVTRAALEGFSSLVPPGGFFVVEDGHVDVPDLHPDGPPQIRALGVRAGGVQPAVAEWLASEAAAGFRLRRDLELYGITSHPGGFIGRD
jgi:cephalosporin hydroxylase